LIKQALIFWIVLLAAAALFPHAPEGMRAAWTFCDRLGRWFGHFPKTEGLDQSVLGETKSVLQAANTSDLAVESSSAVQDQPQAEGGREVSAQGANHNPAVENEELAQAVAAVPDGDLRQALEASLEQHNSHSSQLRQLLVRRWAEGDPKTAASWIGNMQESGEAVSLTKQVAIAWANKDLSGALEWAGALPEGPSRDAAVIGLGYQAARTNSFEAFDLAAGMAPSAERDALLIHFVRQWAATDSVEAANWADRVPDTALRERLLSAVAVSSATKDPYAAASLVATNLSSGRAQDLAAVAIAQRWGQTNSEAASAWINLFPDPSVKLAASLALSALQPAQK
jgi:hypothetical protein